MRKIIFAITLISIFGCSTSKKIDRENKISGAPEWLYAPDQACNNTKELCASGSGESLEGADLNAKVSLASIFQTKITSNFEVQNTSLSSSEVEEMTEKVYSSVEESISEVLNGVFIKKRYLKDDNFFSLASINKNKASKLLRNEIKELDDKLDYLFKEKKRTNLKQMLFVFDKRQMLYERLTILDKSAKPSKYTFGQISNVKSSIVNSNIGINYDESIDNEFKKWFEGMLSDLGYKISKKENNYSLKLIKKVSEQYLKVSGFKKFQFSFAAEALNNSGEKVGTLSVEMISNGRNETDAYLKIKPHLYNKIEQNVYKLNME